MFVLPPNAGEGDLERVKQRPGDWWKRTIDGWQFLPENRLWDSDEREGISRATGLHRISTSEWANGEPDKWWKAFARAYARSHDLNAALSSAVSSADD